MTRVFWRGREGKGPPPHAIFSWRPFASGAVIPALGAVIRVDELPSPTKPIRVLKRHFLPEKKEWVTAVEKALGAIRNQELEKVVLARCCVLECSEPPDPFAITSSLQSMVQNATLYCFADDEMGFLGATPERLFVRSGHSLESEAVAGTRKRGNTPAEDAAWEEELLRSAKDLREFTPVQTFLREALSPLCIAPLSFSPLQVRKTANVQHLYTSLSGTLKQGVSDSHILDQIHPTPALCGAPLKSAFRWIGSLEPFARGLYGGAVGWSTPESAEWAVAIRCCLVRGRIIHLYSGTGIVAGSDPEAEWDELNLKLKLYEGIFV
jgi:menaquinone-specific isochorismate synthase